MSAVVSAASIAGYPGYRVLSDGRVQSRWRNGTRAWREEWRDLTPRLDSKGYGSVTLCAENARRSVRIHRLVAEAFVSNPSKLPCVRHLNGNPIDNRVENLAWGTYRDNEQDKRRHGTYDLRRTGKLTETQREKIRSLAQAGVSQQEIARFFGVSRPTITRLLNGSTWIGPVR